MTYFSVCVCVFFFYSRARGCVRLRVHMYWYPSALACACVHARVAFLSMQSRCAVLSPVASLAPSHFSTLSHSELTTANRSPATREFPRIFRNPKVHSAFAKPATCLYPEPDRSSLCLPSKLSKIHFNINLFSTSRSSRWSSSLRFPH